MDSKIKLIEHVTDFPCLMIFKLQGEVFEGIYLVDELEKPDKNGNRFSVCRIAGNEAAIGKMYFKTELDPTEWFSMPKGTQVTITN